MPFDPEHYIALYDQRLEECDDDRRLIIEHELALIENEHPELRALI